MKRIFGVTAVLLLSTIIAPSSALASSDSTPALAALTGSQEPGAAAAKVTPGSSSATGRATFRLNEEGTALHFSLSAHGLVAAEAAHIHLGGPGTNGPVVAVLFSSAAPVDINGLVARGTITAANLVGPLKAHPLSELITDMRSGDAYTNVHTVANPGGEIRGQIVAEGGEDFGAALTGSQEPGAAAAKVTPGSSTATGRATFRLNEDGSALRFSLSAHGLVAAEAAHIHLGGPGTNGPVVAVLFSSAVPVDISGHVAKGTITAANLVGPLKGHPLSELITDMRSGDAYTNAHTVANPGGEIRGQIVAEDGEDFGAALTGSQEPGAAAAKVTPGSSTATGRATFRLNKDGTALRFSLSAHGLVAAEAAHIHLGGPGTNGPVVAFLFSSAVPVDINGLVARGTITAANLVGPLKEHPLSELISDMRSGDAYTNIHTVANPGGEIRGQIVWEASGD